MNSSFLFRILTVIGIALIGTGLVAIKVVEDPQGIMRSLPYILVGIGCGVFGLGLGEIISQRALKNNPALAKQIKICENDERNMVIAYRAKAKAYDMMVFTLGAILLAYALMDLDMVAILMLVSANLLIIGYRIYYQIKYEREM